MKAIILAVDNHFGIAKDNLIPWLHEGWSKDDLKLFRETTKGGIVVMGRNTYNEIASLRPVGTDILPNRKTYVFTSNIDNICPGATTIDNIDNLINMFGEHKNIFFVGGIGIFEIGLQYADTLFLTKAKRNYECDMFFNPFLEYIWSAEYHQIFDDYTHTKLTKLTNF